MNNYITVKKYSFWKENRISIIIIVLCLIASIYCFIVGSYRVAILNAFAVVMNIVIVYKYLPPKWARNEMKGMKGGYSNKNFIDHLTEDLHSEVGIKIYDDK